MGSESIKLVVLYCSTLESKNSLSSKELDLNKLY
jgi:hypothetical protein